MRGWNPSIIWLCRVEYSRAHKLRLPIRSVDWSTGADSPCFTCSHSALKYLTQSSGNLQETDLQTCWKRRSRRTEAHVRHTLTHTQLCAHANIPRHALLYHMWTHFYTSSHAITSLNLILNKCLCSYLRATVPALNSRSVHYVNNIS